MARIRREFFVNGKSIKEIFQTLKVSRNTVRKALRSSATVVPYERVVHRGRSLGAGASNSTGCSPQTG